LRGSTGRARVGRNGRELADNIFEVGHNRSRIAGSVSKRVIFRNLEERSSLTEMTCEESKVSYATGRKRGG